MAPVSKLAIAETIKNNYDNEQLSLEITYEDRKIVDKPVSAK